MTESAGSGRLTVTKGHGTENDFLVMSDLAATRAPSDALVRALCDRRSGIGADGLLRVIRTELANEPEVRAQAADAEFFMDYRNGDGSIAEMCGNGVRVFARYLRRERLIDGDTVVATRGGPRKVCFDAEQISVEMGRPEFRPETPNVSLAGTDLQPAVAINMPNPHVVVQLLSVEQLLALNLSRPPEVFPPLPDGQNVEFIVTVSERHLRMRVHERGVGETRSCGTGICAAVAAVDPVRERPWTVDVAGGRCTVSWRDGSDLTLTGPAVLVADIQLDPGWLLDHG